MEPLQKKLKVEGHQYEHEQAGLPQHIRENNPGYHNHSDPTMARGELMRKYELLENAATCNHQSVEPVNNTTSHQHHESEVEVTVPTFEIPSKLWTMSEQQTEFNLVQNEQEKEYLPSRVDSMDAIGFQGEENKHEWQTETNHATEEEDLKAEDHTKLQLFEGESDGSSVCRILPFKAEGEVEVEKLLDTSECMPTNSSVSYDQTSEDTHAGLWGKLQYESEPQLVSNKPQPANTMPESSSDSEIVQIIVEDTSNTEESEDKLDQACVSNTFQAIVQQTSCTEGLEDKSHHKSVSENVQVTADHTPIMEGQEDKPPVYDSNSEGLQVTAEHTPIMEGPEDKPPVYDSNSEGLQVTAECRPFDKVPGDKPPAHECDSEGFQAKTGCTPCAEVPEDKPIFGDSSSEQWQATAEHTPCAELPGYKQDIDSHSETLQNGPLNVPGSERLGSKDEPRIIEHRPVLESGSESFGDKTDLESEYECSYQQEDGDQDPKPMSNADAFQKEKVKLIHLVWKKEPEVFEWMWYPTAAVLNGNIFLGDRLYARQYLCVFNIDSRSWFQLPFYDSFEQRGYTLVTHYNQMHSLGGWLRKCEYVEHFSDKILTLNSDFEWVQVLPPLNIGRRSAAANSFESYIIVAGGMSEHGCLSSVEILNCNQPSCTWWSVCDLPVRSELMQCTVTNDEVYIGLGAGTSDVVYGAKLCDIKESMHAYGDSSDETSAASENFWKSLAKTSQEFCGLGVVNNCLIIIGGSEDGQSSSAIHVYDSFKQLWLKVCDIQSGRLRPAIVVCPSENKRELFVLCGYGSPVSVESCEL